MGKTFLETYDQWLENETMPAGKRKSIKAAMHLFAKQGYNGTTTAEIAVAAGVSQATIFKYFKTKDDLLTTIITPTLPQLFQEFYPRLIKYKTLQDTVEFVVQDRFRFIASNQTILKIIFQECLVNEKFRLEIKNSLRADDITNKMIDYFHYLKRENPEMNQELSPSEIMRTFIGPLFAYFAQRFIFNINTVDEKNDLNLISHQISNSLIG